jgi:hypothetical protein
MSSSDAGRGAGRGEDVNRATIVISDAPPAQPLDHLQKYLFKDDLESALVVYGMPPEFAAVAELASPTVITPALKVMEADITVLVRSETSPITRVSIFEFQTDARDRDIVRYRQYAFLMSDYYTSAAEDYVPVEVTVIFPAGARRGTRSSFTEEGGLKFDIRQIYLEDMEDVTGIVDRVGPLIEAWNPPPGDGPVPPDQLPVSGPDRYRWFIYPLAVSRSLIKDGPDGSPDTSPLLCEEIGVYLEKGRMLAIRARTPLYHAKSVLAARVAKCLSLAEFMRYKKEIIDMNMNYEALVNEITDGDFSRMIDERVEKRAADEAKKRTAALEERTAALEERAAALELSLKRAVQAFRSESKTPEEISVVVGLPLPEVKRLLET